MLTWTPNKLQSASSQTIYNGFTRYWHVYTLKALTFFRNKWTNGTFHLIIVSQSFLPSFSWLVLEQSISVHRGAIVYLPKNFSMPCPNLGRVRHHSGLFHSGSWEYRRLNAYMEHITCCLLSLEQLSSQNASYSCNPDFRNPYGSTSLLFLEGGSISFLLLRQRLSPRTCSPRPRHSRWSSTLWTCPWRRRTCMPWVGSRVWRWPCVLCVSAGCRWSAEPAAQRRSSPVHSGTNPRRT